MKERKILVVDDEEIVQDVLGSLFRKNGYRVAQAMSAEEGLGRLDGENPDLVLLDILLPGMSGLEALGKIVEINPALPVIMMTAYGTIESAVEAMKLGAFHYLTKPFKNEEVLNLADKAIKQKELKEENLALRKAITERHRFEELVGKSKKMLEIYRLIEQIAPSRSTVLIEGESGTGKELVAKAIHNKSQRSSHPFVVVNSMNISSELLESNLFGHVKGAFTGATNDKKGLFEVADKGSIFFDEISTIKGDVQSKLLRVIQEREFLPLGSVDSKRVDVRIIAATNVDLKRLVEEGNFREDLYYRLNVINIVLPPLRERKEDVPLLVSHFLEKYSAENGKILTGVSKEVMALLMKYHWPGNVRELENFIERGVVLASGDEIGMDLVAEEITHVRQTMLSPFRPEQSEMLSLNKAIDDYERGLITEALRRCRGVQKKAAELLGIKPTTLNEKIKKLQIKI
ncbi:MAG: sigma-54 dependent transcriptional regulator [Acidobacteriota bacterium]